MSRTRNELYELVSGYTAAKCSKLLDLMGVLCPRMAPARRDAVLSATFGRDSRCRIHWLDFFIRAVDAYSAHHDGDFAEWHLSSLDFGAIAANPAVDWGPEHTDVLDTYMDQIHGNSERLRPT